MSNEKKFQKLYEDFLKRKIKEYCNDNGYYELYWDYREKISPNQLLKAFRNYKKDGYEKIEDYLESELYLYENCLNYEDDFYIAVIQDLEKEDFYTEEFEEWFKENYNLYEDLEDCGYNGLDVNLDGLLKNSKFHINIMFATPEEQNSDMSSIFYSYQELDNLNDFNKKFDNSLSYLIHQQGHTIKEFFEESDNNSNFVKSVVSEVNNFPYYSMSELTALVKLEGKEALEFLNYLEDNSLNENLKLSKDTMFGLFNEWNGSGSVFEIELEKDFIVPKEMIRGIQIEGVKNEAYTFTVDEVYDLISDCWKETLSLTEEEPELVEENEEETVRFLKEYVLSHEESDEEEM